MSTASSATVARLAVAFDRLERAVSDCDRIRRPPAKLPNAIDDLASALCGDAECSDLDAAIVMVDRVSAQLQVRALMIERMTDAIRKAAEGGR